MHYKACTKEFPVLLCTTKLAQSTSQYYLVLQSLHKGLPSTTVYYKACTKDYSQYYFLLQSLHKGLPSTTVFYKACANYLPVILSTTKLAQRSSQYYLVLQSLHKIFPSTTLHYKACAKHFPVLLCTTKLAQRTSQYYFVLQSLYKALPNTTLSTKLAQKYYCVLKSFTKHFPVLLCTTKLAQSTSQYYLVPQSLHKKNQRLETRHVGAARAAFLCETSSNFDTFGTLVGPECHKAPRLPRKTTWQPAWKPSKRGGFAASPIDTATPQENQRLETRHVGAAKRGFRARLPPILTLSTPYQTGWNVTKCHACHAKRHDNLLWNLQKGEVLQLPP